MFRFIIAATLLLSLLSCSIEDLNKVHDLGNQVRSGVETADSVVNDVSIFLTRLTEYLQERPDSNISNTDSTQIIIDSLKSE